MTVERDRDPIVFEHGMPFCDKRRAVPRQRAKNGIVQTGDADTAELHDVRAREHLPASSVCVAFADDVLHVCLAVSLK
jgi:hypothetical protein